MRKTQRLWIRLAYYIFLCDMANLICHRLFPASELGQSACHKLLTAATNQIPFGMACFAYLFPRRSRQSIMSSREWLGPAWAFRPSVSISNARELDYSSASQRWGCRRLTTVLFDAAAVETLGRRKTYSGLFDGGWRAFTFGA